MHDARAPLIVTLADLRALTWCTRGARAFAERHGLDWERFVREGLPAQALIDTDDALARALVERARARRLAAEVRP